MSGLGVEVGCRGRALGLGVGLGVGVGSGCCVTAGSLAFPGASGRVWYWFVAAERLGRAF